MYAASVGHLDILKWLLSKGADIDKKNEVRTSINSSNRRNSHYAFITTTATTRIEFCMRILYINNLKTFTIQIIFSLVTVLQFFKNQ